MSGATASVPSPLRHLAFLARYTVAKQNGKGKESSYGAAAAVAVFCVNTIERWLVLLPYAPNAFPTVLSQLSSTYNISDFVFVMISDWKTKSEMTTTRKR